MNTFKKGQIVKHSKYSVSKNWPLAPCRYVVLDSDWGAHTSTLPLYCIEGPAKGSIVHRIPQHLELVSDNGV